MSNPESHENKTLPTCRSQPGTIDRREADALDAVLAGCK